MAGNLTVISYGGGVQSTALVAMAATGYLQQRLGLRPDAALFSNVGDDSEHPGTLRYVRNVVIPWAASRGLTIHELERRKRTGETETLWGRLMREDSRSLPIPVRMPDTGAPGTRSCTRDFKIAVIGKWLKANGATADTPATVCIGISTDEIQRVSNKRAEPYESPRYPLIELGMNRADCMRYIQSVGLPVPGKSSCFFCPFHRPLMWSEMRRDEPELFERAAQLEETLNRRRDKLGKDRVYLTRFGKPLRDAIGEAQQMLPVFAAGPDLETCDEGACWT